MIDIDFITKFINNEPFMYKHYCIYRLSNMASQQPKGLCFILLS